MVKRPGNANYKVQILRNTVSDMVHVLIVLSSASAHTCASAHPSILTVLWFFEVLHVTAHHAKFLCSESEGTVGPLSSHSCDCSDVLWAPQYQASKVCTHLSVASFAAFLPGSTKFVNCK